MFEPDPSLERPGTSSGNNSPTPDDLQVPASAQTLKAPWVIMRLLVIKSSVLPRKHKIAMVDAYAEVQFGRDVAPVGSDIPRIRLKEMEVSKFHATVYWDAERREWAVVDMGSKHGTYLKSSEGGSGSEEEQGKNGVRLSPPRMSSVPRRLRHLDHLTIGSTTFRVHIHDGHMPCEECSPVLGDEIPLFSTTRSRTDRLPTPKRSLAAAGMDEGTVRSKDPKKALTMLKHTLLTRHDEAHQPADSRTRYVDRSAARRVRQSGSYHDAPGISLRITTPELSSPSSATASGTENEIDVTPSPAAPIPTTNIGHRLLVKQGWQPGTSLGVPGPDGEDTGLIVPLDLGSNRDRAGLGVARETFVTRPPDWKAAIRQKRWEDARLHNDGCPQ